MRTWLLDRSWTLLLTAILVGSIIYNVDGSDNYLTVDNLVNLFELSIEKIIVVVAINFVIIAGEIDLSVAWLQDSGDVPFAVAVLVALIASAAVGYTQGWLITRLGLPSLVVTLAGLITWRGVARILVEDRSYGDFPEWFDRLGQEELLGPLPFSIAFFVVVLVTAAFVLHRSEFGRYVYVIGDNSEVARFAGVNATRVRTALFVASSLTAGLAGVLFAARLGSIRGDLAVGFELEIITIVLLGGVSIFGGSGGLGWVALAVLIVLNVRNGLGLNDVDGSTQSGVIGGILILSVLLQNALDRVTSLR